MAFYLHGWADVCEGREGGLQVAICVGAQIGEDGRGGIVCYMDVRRAEESGEEGWKGGAGANFDDGQVGYVEMINRRALEASEKL